MHLYHLHTNILASSASAHCIKRNAVVYLKLVIDILHIEEACVCSPKACIVFTLAETVDLQGYCFPISLCHIKFIIVNYTNGCKDALFGI